MSNLKYDNETCGNIIELLEYSENMLEQAKTEISDYYRNVPTSDEINARIKKLSLETDEFGKEIESLTASNETYYMNLYLKDNNKVKLPGFLISEGMLTINKILALLLNMDRNSILLIRSL